MNRPSNPSRGFRFTLIELLVVVAIIGVLASLLLPSLAKAREAAKYATCQSNLKQIAIAVSFYTGDNNELTMPFYPWAYGKGNNIATISVVNRWPSNTPPDGIQNEGPAGLGNLWFDVPGTVPIADIRLSNYPRGLYLDDSRIFYCSGSPLLEQKPTSKGIDSNTWDRRYLGYTYRNPERGLNSWDGKKRGGAGTIQLSELVSNGVVCAYDNVGPRGDHAWGQAHRDGGNALWYDGSVTKHRYPGKAYTDGWLENIPGRTYNYPQGDEFVKFVEAENGQ